MRNKIIEILKRLGVLNTTFLNQTANKIMSYSGIEKVTPEVLEKWLSGIDFTFVSYKASYFARRLEVALKEGEFFPVDNSVSATASVSENTVQEKQTAEQVEQSWEDWKELIDDTPSRGVICSDDTNFLRAVSDGKGGLIYIDGTVSEKYPRLEDLEPAEQQELISTVKALHGSIAYLDKVVRSMQQHATAS